MASFAATPAACPTIMYCGSMRSVLNATWLAEKHTGTSRLVACARFVDPRDVDARSRHEQVRVGLFVVPQVDLRRPSVDPMHQQPCLDEALAQGKNYSVRKLHELHETIGK